MYDVLGHGYLLIAVVCFVTAVIFGSWLLVGLGVGWALAWLLAVLE